LVLPPRLAPIQAVIVPIWRKDQERAAVLEAARALYQQLAPTVRVKLDDRDELSPGWKFNDWEMRGVPLRIEVGPRDVAQQTVMLARRDMPGREGKTSVAQAGLPQSVAEMLATVQQVSTRKRSTSARATSLT
jgi:prolyl-tRNA synthetase